MLAREEEEIWGPLARLQQAPPACWSWEVTADHTATALRSAFAATQAEVERIAKSLLDAWHAGRCAICGPSAILAGELVTDHDHATGLVRGLLCRQCNTYEGLNCGGRDTAGVYARYRELPPATILGIRLRYYDPFQRRHASQAPPPSNNNPLHDAGL